MTKELKYGFLFYLFNDLEREGDKDPYYYYYDKI